MSGATVTLPSDKPGAQTAACAAGIVTGGGADDAQADAASSAMIAAKEWVFMRGVPNGPAPMMRGAAGDVKCARESS